ncbi:Mu-like prophage major head subunit gpT family protein [Citricoccus sp. K5]|uniref:phage major capsid protein n=1 Tax=Citricoccus sp. K5 TaxID=2653135 RepID=UPI0012F3A11A|nr:Mu-like prophage major head subunit gpT family protein [Citricoccus sp. K5]VXA92508.1 conserved hypothetical protein [Citricoccus sp. K5]VXA94805.1 conserved hypothetical protein [Citricoccus sp. K5]
MTILNTEELLLAEGWEKRNAPSQGFLTNMVEAAKLFNDGMKRGNPFKKAMLSEALTRGDFNIYLGAAFDREMLAKYEDLTPEWQKLARATTVKDFKPKTFVDLFGGRGALDEVKEGAEYKERNKDAAKYELAVKKFGNLFKLTWELIVNDDLDGLTQLPADLAQGAIETEDKAAFEAFVSAAGPKADFFKSANGNAVDNKPLTRANLQAAYVAISKRKDKNGNPSRVANSKMQLVVPAALMFEAEQLVSTPTIPNPEGGSGMIPNPLAGKFTVVVSDYLTVVNTSAKADTTWYLLPAPTASRPALVVAKLRGQENPDIRVKADQGQRLTGGAISPEEGSFGDDTIAYRGRHVVGAGTLDPMLTYASTGS